MSSAHGELCCDKNQTKWLINVMHRFHSKSIKGAAIFNCELRIYLVPQAFRHKILTYSGISGDIEGQEAEKSEFQVIMKPLPSFLKGHRLVVSFSDRLSTIQTQLFQDGSA